MVIALVLVGLLSYAFVICTWFLDFMDSTKKLRYYRQLAAPILPNDQTPK